MSGAVGNSSNCVWAASTKYVSYSLATLRHLWSGQLEQKLNKQEWKMETEYFVQIPFDIPRKLTSLTFWVTVSNKKKPGQ